MHTAICAFDDRARAEHAMESLVRSGFGRHDVHIEHRDLRRERPTESQWDGMEREIAVGPGVLSSFGRFFASLLGRDHPSGHVDTYAQHVESGRYVVVVDAHDAADAERARAMLHELQASDLNVVHRPERRPLRDIVGMRQEDGSDLVERSREPYEGWTGSGATSMAGDRAMADHRVSPTAGPELRDPDLERPPGLRYADKDKPNG